MPHNILPMCADGHGESLSCHFSRNLITKVRGQKNLTTGCWQNGTGLYFNQAGRCEKKVRPCFPRTGYGPNASPTANNYALTSGPREGRMSGRNRRPEAQDERPTGASTSSG